METETVGCHCHPDKRPAGICVHCGRLVCAECRVILNNETWCEHCAKELFPHVSMPKDSNWFHEHLNWTWVVAWSISIGLSYCGIALLDATGLVLIVFVSGWVIHQKRRTLWWILLSPAFSPLWLENKRAVASARAQEVFMPDDSTQCELTVSRKEADSGTKRLLIRKRKRLEVAIPAGVSVGSVVRLRGALQVTDGVDGDILIRVKEVGDGPSVVKDSGFWSLMLSLFTVFLATVVYNLLSGVNHLLILAFFSGAIVLGGIQLGRRFSRLAFTGLAIGVLSILYYFAGIYVNLQTVPESPGQICNLDGFVELGGNWRPIELVNNPNSQDPSWNELVAFIREDTTSSKRYIDTFYWGYVCTDYARDVHNKAEAAGIRAAWVGIDFVEGGCGHALNAFHTTDKELVFIDCTGFDTMAYLKEGHELGFLDLDPALSSDYSFYEQNKSRSPCPPMGVVLDVQIHWGP